MRAVGAALVLLAALCVCDAVTFGQLCAGNSGNTIRGRDGWGQGHFGASRTGGKSHEGVDVECSDGSDVYAPFDVTVTRGLTVYNNPGTKGPINKGMELRGGGLCFKLFYVEPAQTSGSVSRGQRIGTMLPMQSVFPGMTSHVHVQMCDKSDPTPHF